MLERLCASMPMPQTARLQSEAAAFLARGLLALSAGYLLVGCGANPCLNTNYKVVGKISGTGSGVKFLTVPAGTTTEQLRGVASSACGNRWCKLLIWDDFRTAGSSLPLTQEQADSQLAAYDYNPQTDSERLLVRGEEVPMGSCSNR